MIHLKIETIITVSVKSKRMKIIIRVFPKKNAKNSEDYKLIKEPPKILLDSPPLPENVPLEDVKLYEIIPEKVPTLNGIKLPKTKEQWLQANAHFTANENILQRKQYHRH